MQVDRNDTASRIDYKPNREQDNSTKSYLCVYKGILDHYFHDLLSFKSPVILFQYQPRRRKPPKPVAGSILGETEAPGPSTSPSSYLEPDSRSYPRERSPIGQFYKKNIFISRYSGTWAKGKLPAESCNNSAST